MSGLLLMQISVAGYLIGANVWFFFLQSPALILFLGREKFVPIQMRLTKLLFRAHSVAGVVLLILSWSVGGKLSVLGASIAMIASLVAHFFVIPRALRAGGKGRAETAAEGGDSSVAKFASEGSGPSAAFWHRTVVVFVVLILIGALLNMYGATGA